MLEPLVAKLRLDEPTKRPTASEALSEMFQLIQAETVASLSKPLFERDGTFCYTWPKHSFEARVKRIHPLQPPVPGVKVEELKPVPLLCRLRERFRFIL